MTTQAAVPCLLSEAGAVFATRGPLSLVEPDARARLLAAARPMFVQRGARVFAAGDGPGGIFGVVSGGIGVETSSAILGPRLGHVMRAGSWLGEGPALRGGERRLGYRALEDSRLLAVPLPVLRQLLHDNPGIARVLAVISEINSSIAALAVRELLIPLAPQRIAAVLLRVTGATEGVEPDDPRGILLTQSDLGEMANASRLHVNRVLRMLAREGWIETSYNHVRVLDAPALTRFASAD